MNRAKVPSTASVAAKQTRALVCLRIAVMVAVEKSAETQRQQSCGLKGFPSRANEGWTSVLCVSGENDNERSECGLAVVVVCLPAHIWPG